MNDEEFARGLKAIEDAKARKEAESKAKALKPTQYYSEVFVQLRKPALELTGCKSVHAQNLTKESVLSRLERENRKHIRTNNLAIYYAEKTWWDKLKELFLCIFSP